MLKRLKNLLRVFILIILACNSGQSQQQKPEKVYRIVYEIRSNDWYTKQAELWKKEIDNNPQNAEAWHNYYNAVRYARYTETIETKNKKEQLNKIIEEMGKAIPESYEYYLLKYKTDCNLQKISVLEKAHKLKPEEPEPYYDIIVYNEVHGNKDRVDEYYEKLYNSKDIAPWLINYNYNVLMSIEQDAILFTNGDNDTYPARMLQSVHGIRNDITIMNISLSTIESYFKNKIKQKDIQLDHKSIFQQGAIVDANQKKHFSKSHFVQAMTKAITEKYPDVPIYFALTVYEENFKPFKEDMYVVGLAYRYSPKRIDNIALLKKNLQQNFRLDYLKYDWYTEHFPGERLMAQTNLNYVAPAIMLAEHYQTSGQEEKATQWKYFSLDIARRAGNQTIIDDIEKKVLE